LAAGFLFLAILLLILTAAPLWASTPSEISLAPDYQLLINPGVETYDPPEAYDPPNAQFDGVNCQMATGWQPFPSGNIDPCWMDTRVFAASHLGGGWVERIEGDTSQLIVSTQPYTAGIRQQVGGLTPGLGYGFHAAMLTIFQTSAQDPVHGTMIKEVGIDPTGGTDPQSPAVVWSLPDGHDQGPWDVERVTAAYAQAPTVTVYVRVTSPYPSGGLPLMNLSFLDSAILARTGSVSAVSPSISESTSFLVRWDNALPSPGGTIRWFDVQWLDEAEGVWHDWFYRTDALSAIFSGQRGHTYRFRARVWQRYPNGAHLFSPYGQEGDTLTWVRGPQLLGRVWAPREKPAAFATVAISGTHHRALSGLDGTFSLPLSPVSGTHAITVSHPAWLAPPPVHGLTFELTETQSLTWTLRPLDDALINGGFEAGMDGWMSTPSATWSVTAPVHTGRAALALQLTPTFGIPLSVTLGAPFSLPLTASLSQTVLLTDAWHPALSFWYRSASYSAGDRLNLVLTVVTQALSTTLPLTPPVTAGLATPLTEPLTTTLTFTTTRVFTPPLDVAGWHYFWAYPSPFRTALTGTVSIDFRLWLTRDQGLPLLIYLDEISLGSTPGGPLRFYLPLILRHY
jgi:hypothetical protein